MAAGLAVLTCGSAKAVILDQIGTSPTFITSQNAYTSDVFQSADAAYDTVVVDDFTVTGPTLLTKVYAATDGFGSFVSYSDVTDWSVEIYSSLAAANSNIVGDVYHKTFAPGGVTLTTPFGGSSTSALLNVSTSIILPTAGTYYLAVLADNSEATNGIVGIYSTTGVSNSTPGGLNAYQENPQGGFGFTGNQSALNLDAAYAVVGVTVPEPTAPVIAGVAVGALALSRRRRRVM